MAWPEWKDQARIIADVLKEHIETASDYAEEMSYRMEGMTDCPEFLDLESLQQSIDNVMAHAQRANVQLTVLRMTIPKEHA